VATQRGNRRGRGGRDESGEALRALVGAGPSKVGISAALRTRDASRPTDEDLAAAEAMPPPRVGPPVSTPPKAREAAPADQPGNGGSEPSAS
jgi:hypothetical protein